MCRTKFRVAAMFGTPIFLCPHEPSPLPRVNRSSSTAANPNVMVQKCLPVLSLKKLIKSQSDWFPGEGKNALSLLSPVSDLSMVSDHRRSSRSSTVSRAWGEVGRTSSSVLLFFPFTTFTSYSVGIFLLLTSIAARTHRLSKLTLFPK